jgi:hypothetical protein
MQGPTLVVVRSTTGHTFGTYANAPWTSPAHRTWTNAGGCFMFLVENPHNDPPTCFECKNPQSAFYCGSSFGPYTSDIQIHPHGDAGQCATALGTKYTDTLGRGAATFTGASNFTLEDYEVWGVN